VNETRERSAWREVGERHPILVSMLFPRASVAYRSAQVTLGRRFPYATLIIPKLLVPIVLGTIVAYIWLAGVPVPDLSWLSPPEQSDRSVVPEDSSPSVPVWVWWTVPTTIVLIGAIAVGGTIAWRNRWRWEWIW